MNLTEWTLQLRDLASAGLAQFAANAENAFDRAERASDAASTRMSDGISSKLGGALKKAFGVAALLGVAKEAGEFIGSTIGDALERQKIQTSFNVLTGSDETGEQLTKQLVDLQNQTVLGGEVFKNAQTLLSQGFDSSQVTKTLHMLGDVAMGDAEKLNSLTLAFSQTRQAGRLTGQDLMQYINAGFNPLNEIAKKTGKSMAQLKDDVSKGLITFDMVQDAFRSATSEGGQFNNMLGKIAETPAGKMEQLKGAWEEMKIKAGEAFMPLLSAAMELAEKVMPMIETGIGKLAELVSPFVDKIKDGKEQFGGLMDYVNIVKDIVVNTIVPFFEKLWGIVSDIVVDIVEFVSQSEILKDAFKLIGEFAASVYDWISNILDAFSWLWNNVVMPLLEGLDKAYSAIKDLFGYGDKKGASSGRKQVTAPKAVTTSDNETKTILNDIKTNTNQNTAATKDAVSAVKGGGQKVINIQIGKFFDNIQFQTTNLTESVEDIEQTVLECMGRVLLNGAVAGTQ